MFTRSQLKTENAAQYLRLLRSAGLTITNDQAKVAERSINKLGLSQGLKTSTELLISNSILIDDDHGALLINPDYATDEESIRKWLGSLTAKAKSGSKQGSNPSPTPTPNLSRPTPEFLPGPHTQEKANKENQKEEIKNSLSSSFNNFLSGKIGPEILASTVVAAAFGSGKEVIEGAAGRRIVGQGTRIGATAIIGSLVSLIVGIFAATLFAGPLVLLIFVFLWLFWKFISRKSKQKRLRNLGKELIPVSRSTGVLFSSLADRRTPQAFRIVLAELNAELDELGDIIRTKADKERNNDLSELIDRITAHFGSVDNASAVLDGERPFIPNEVYTLRLPSSAPPNPFTRLYRFLEQLP